MDAFGSDAVHRLSMFARSRVQSWGLARGRQATAPISPGEPGWSFATGQRQFFQLVNARMIGVPLTRGNMMLPKKSASFVIGVAPDINQTSVVSWRLCNLADTCRCRTTCEKPPLHRRGDPHGDLAK
jgi:hypothetical protein